MSKPKNHSDAPPASLETQRTQRKALHKVLAGYGRLPISCHPHPCGRQACLRDTRTWYTHAECRCVSGTESPLFRTPYVSFLCDAFLRDLCASAVESRVLDAQASRELRPYYIQIHNKEMQNDDREYNGRRCRPNDEHTSPACLHAVLPGHDFGNDGQYRIGG